MLNQKALQPLTSGIRMPDAARMRHVEALEAENLRLHKRIAQLEHELFVVQSCVVAMRGCRSDDAIDSDEELQAMLDEVAPAAEIDRSHERTR